jgi:hypothetical protein
VTLTLRHGYVWDGPNWGAEEKTRTRLGEPTVTLRLGKLVDGKLVPRGRRSAAAVLHAQAGGRERGEDYLELSRVFDGLLLFGGPVVMYPVKGAARGVAESGVRHFRRAP